ncbi:cob(I)yrinic acid a,c-diamide adenosyltransferase [Ruminococcus sp.]|uniref:cob(I)yrinic acid a,c-diamide adenosyltransferase n=1 Tax=Ruminococcus sp. TaxID=41978 RepID=UPI00388DED2E
MLEIYYGTARGKTSLCVGAAVRAALREKNVLLVSFDPVESDHKKLFDAIPHITALALPASADVREFFDHAARMAMSFRYTVLVFDGVFDVLAEDRLSAAEVYEFLSNAPDSIEIICTGAAIPKKFFPLADHMVELKKAEG